MRRLLITIAMTVLFVGGSALSAHAGPLPDNCTKDKGTVTCTTFDGPGKNQGGVGSLSIDETQGNTTNTSPDPQDLDSSCTVNPPNSQGAPNSC